MSKKTTQAKTAAIKSSDANRILLVFARSVATALYYNSLNAVTANKLSDAELMKLKGVKKHGVDAIRCAVRTATRKAESGSIFTIH